MVHKAQAYDWEMSLKAIERLNAAIGSQNIPLRTEIFSLKDIAQAHERLERVTSLERSLFPR
ncbi:hypothetical protein GCM10011586_40010 [Silvibacterium dinghuense]|nr:hypothetical protein GCM10011586_40010 [Silvibacterium dinghuense]